MAFTEAFCILEHLIVAELGERLPDRGLGENFAEPTAQRFGFHFLAKQTLEAVAQFLGSPAQMRFENLSHVHARRNAERIENDLHRSAVGHVGHVFLRNNARDDALVPVAPGHFVADRKLAFHGDIDLDQLDDAGRQLVALLELFLALFGDLAKHIDLTRSHLLDLFYFLDEQRIFFVEFQALQVTRGNLFDDFTGKLDALGQQALVGLFVVQVSLQNFAAEQIGQALETLVGQDTDFVGEVLFQFENLCGFDGLVPLVFFFTLASEDFHVDDSAFDAWRAIERSVANVSGFFTEDSAQQLFLRRQRGFALRRNLADQNVAGLDDGADTNDTAFVEGAKERFADVGDVASNFFRAKLGGVRFDFVLLDVDGGVVVDLHQLFADEDGVFEVVAAPRKERDQHVAPESQFTALGARTVCQNLDLLHTVANTNERLLADARVLVRTLEFNRSE